MKKEMTAENMQQVINENINLVSDKTRESFDAMSLEDQYKKILKLIANKKFQEKKKANNMDEEYLVLKIIETNLKLI